MPHPPARFRATVAHFALTGALTALCVASPAQANGRFPSAQHLVVGPGAASDALALRTTFGVLTSADAGRSWQWRCEEMLGYSYTAVWDPPIALGAALPGARLLVGLTDGLTASPDACAASPVGPLQGRFVGDLTTSPDGRTVWVVSSDNRPNGLYVSRDGGSTFTAFGRTVDGVFFETVEVAPSDPRRLYLTGVTRDEPQRAVLYRSDDGGATLREMAWSGPPVERLYVSGVDPRDPAVLYLRATLPGATTTALLRASDGGTTVRELTRLDDAMRGFALSDDGRRVFVGSPDAGLLRAVDGGAFARVAGYQVQCLRFHAGALYVCANELADGFALGRSTDDGAQVTALLRLGELREPNTCPAGSTWTTRCAALWALVQSGLRPLRDAGPDTGPVDAAGDAEGGADGSTGRPGPTDAGRGCACGVVVAQPAPGAHQVAGLVLALGLCRRRKRRVPRR